MRPKLAKKILKMKHLKWIKVLILRAQMLNCNCCHWLQQIYSTVDKVKIFKSVNISIFQSCFSICYSKKVYTNKPFKILKVILTSLVNRDISKKANILPNIFVKRNKPSLISFSSPFPFPFCFVDDWCCHYQRRDHDDNQSD